MGRSGCDSGFPNLATPEEKRDGAKSYNRQGKKETPTTCSR